MNKINVENILTQVSLIKQKYDDLAEYTGENYNILNVLNVYSDELSHSKIIGNLLNVKGKHGQKDTFLKLFLNQINYFKEDTKLYNNLRSFNSIQSSVAIEKTIGRVNYATNDGGRIDILINDGKNNIIVENKIWAADGYQQLARYRRYDENAPIIYLTLEGEDPDDISIKASQGQLEFGVNYVCVSYKNDIINWLESCIKEVANKPIIRESIYQYIALLKQLTNQSTNKKMKEEIFNLIFQNEANLEAFIEIQNVHNDFYKTIIKNNLIQDINQIAQDLNLKVHFNENSLLLQNKWPGFYFDNEQLRKNEIKIHFSANKTSSFSDVIFGITSNKLDSVVKQKLQDDFKREFKNNKPVNHWICKIDYTDFKNFNDLKTLQKVHRGEFKTDLNEKVKILKRIIESNL